MGESSLLFCWPACARRTTFPCLRTTPTLPTLLPLRSCTPVPVPTDPWDRPPVLRGMPTATFPCLRTMPTLPTLLPLRSCTPVLVPTDPWDRPPVLRGMPTATFPCLRTMPTLPTLLLLRSCTPVPVPTDPWDRLPVLRGMPTATFPCLRTTPTLPTLLQLRSCTPVLVPTDPSDRQMAALGESATALLPRPRATAMSSRRCPPPSSTPRLKLTAMLPMVREYGMEMLISSDWAPWCVSLGFG